jgi:hypothetical protein
MLFLIKLFSQFTTSQRKFLYFRIGQSEVITVYRHVHLRYYSLLNYYSFKLWANGFMAPCSVMGGYQYFGGELLSTLFRTEDEGND